MGCCSKKKRKKKRKKKVCLVLWIGGVGVSGMGVDVYVCLYFRKLSELKGVK